MPQGKLKIKSKLPSGVKPGKQLKRQQTKNSTPKTVASQRSNKPIQPKKLKSTHMHNVKRTLTKAVNKTVEDEMRARATDQVKNLSKAQVAVAAHNTKSSKVQSKSAQTK